MSTAPSGSSRPTWLLPILLLVAAVLALGLRFGACSQDDAFISFRYAANLLEGQGLVFNPGERVEGYTNLSWTLLMAGLMGLGVDPVLGSAVLGLLCFGAVLPLTAALTQRAAAPGGALVTVGAAALVALDPWAVLESVEGLETALYTLLLTAAAWRILCENEVQGFVPTAHLGSGLLLSAAALTRPEAPMIAGLLHLGLLAGAPNRGLQLRRSLWAALPVLLTLGALTAWRLGYYGDPLPNTFYAKTGGAPLARGLVYLGAHARFHPALWLLMVLRPAALRLDRRALPLAFCVLGTLAYVLAVGGDFKPTGRFLMPVLPMMAALGAPALLAVARPSRRGAAAALAGLLLLAGALPAGAEADQWAAIRHANLEARRTVGLFLKQNLPADTRIAIHSAGAVPFYAGLPTIDMWGLTDRTIARSPTPAAGTGLAGHERSDPSYVFSRDPAIYLPEDRMFTLKAHPQPVEPGFPPDFAQRYQPLSIPVQGRFLNVWVRKGFLARLHGG